MPSDKWGNKLFVDTYGVYLKLNGVNYSRKIFSFRGKEVVKYVKQNHIMKTLEKGKMIGFNHDALKLLKQKGVKYIWIMLYNGKRKGKVKIDDILELKEFLHFKHEGFERQVFYPIKLIGKEDESKKKE